MAHWAELDENNIVIRVLVSPNEETPEENHQWLVDNLGGKWVQTSYTSRGGNRFNPSNGEIVKYNDHFRYNFAGIGFFYDEQADAFISPKPYDDWVLDTTSYTWVKPYEDWEPPLVQ